VGAMLAERHVVLVLTARIGASGELHVPPTERAVGEALRDRGEQRLVVLADRRRVEVELRRIAGLLLRGREAADARDLTRHVQSLRLHARQLRWSVDGNVVRR